MFILYSEMALLLAAKWKSIQNNISWLFYQHGLFCASHPLAIIASVITIVLFMSYVLYFNIHIVHLVCNNIITPWIQSSRCLVGDQTAVTVDPLDALIFRAFYRLHNLIVFSSYIDWHQLVLDWSTTSTLCR